MPSNTPSDDITPRTLVRYTFYEPGSDDIRRVAFDAIQPQGTIKDANKVDAEPIGYAEFPPHTKVGRYGDLEAFRDRVESNAEYVHWKPPLESNIDLIGDADAHALATAGGESDDETENAET